MLNLRRPLRLPYGQYVRFRFGRSIVALKVSGLFMIKKKKANSFHMMKQKNKNKGPDGHVWKRILFHDEGNVVVSTIHFVIKLV